MSVSGSKCTSGECHHLSRFINSGRLLWTLLKQYRVVECVRSSYENPSKLVYDIKRGRYPNFYGTVYKELMLKYKVKNTFVTLFIDIENY